MAGRITAATDGSVGWLTFDSPAKRNAMSLEMWLAVPAALQAFSADPAVRLVVMRGAGDEAFVSGADISEFEAERSDLQSAGRYNAANDAAFTALGRFEKPLVAMVRGWCMGGGLAIAMKADIRICADDAKFGIPAGRLGVAYPAGSVRDLVGLVGPSEAKSILFTAKRLDAAEALRIGLANEVVPVAGLEARIAELAETIADNAPLSLLASKEAVDQIAQDRPDPGRLDALSALCFGSADYAEGRRAFMEKRRPAFTGR